MNMRKLLFILPLLLVGCMQHNGHIGDWFGQWHVTSIEINGADDAGYADNIFFQFQADKVHILAVDPSYPTQTDECFGSWEATDQTLLLDFSYTGGGKYFTPFDETHLDNGRNLLKILHFSSKKLTLQLTKENETITYTLKKQ